MGERMINGAVLQVGRGGCNSSVLPQTFCLVFSGSGSLRGGRREAEQAWPSLGRTAEPRVAQTPHTPPPPASPANQRVRKARLQSSVSGAVPVPELPCSPLAI